MPETTAARWTLVIALCVALCGCFEDDEPQGSSAARPSSRPASYGHAASARLVRYTDCTGRAVEANKPRVVAAINGMFGPIKSQVPGEVEKLYPLIDDGTLPRMVADLRTIANMVLGDPEVMRALATVAEQLRQVNLPVTVDAIGQLLNYPELERLLEATSEILEADDGKLLNSLLGLASSLLEQAGSWTAGEAGDPDAALAARRALVDELLRELPEVENGPAVTIDRLGADGRPLGASETRRDPFPTYEETVPDGPRPGSVEVVERQGGGLLGGLFDGLDWQWDGLVDMMDGGVHAVGTFLNGGEQTYAEEVLGREIARRDAPDRERTVGPKIRMDRTVLATLTRALGESVKHGLHCELAKVLPALLGERVGDGFDPHGPLPALQHGLLELLKYDHAPKLLDALAMTLESDPELGQALLARALRVVAQVREMELPESADPDRDRETSRKMMVANLKLFDHIFRTPVGMTKKGESSGRVLLRVLTQLGEQGRQVPAEFALMFKYRKMVRGDNGDGNLIDEDRSIPVDRSKPAFYVDSSGETIDNRSCFHRLANLDRVADRCKIPVINKRLGLLYHELLAELTPATAVLFSDLMTKALKASGVVTALICKDIDKHLDAMEELATSGAMDALIPVMKLFKQAEQLELFLDLLLVMNDHYEVIRPQEELIVAILESGVVEAGIDLLGVMNAVEVPGTEEVVADVLADFVGDLLDHTQGAVDIRGEEVPARVYLLMDPLEALTAQLAEDAEATGALTRLLDKGVELFFQLRHDDGGTPDDPSDDFDELGNDYIVPLLARALSLMAARLPRDADRRAVELRDAQEALPKIFEHRALGELVDALGYYCSNENRQVFDDLIVYALTPGETPETNLYGTVIAVAGTLLQTQLALDGEALGVLMRFAGKLLDPRLGILPNLTTGIRGILAVSEGGPMMGVARRAFSRSLPGMGGESPVQLIVRIGTSCAPSGPISEAHVRDLMHMLHKIAEIGEVMFSLVLTREGGPGGQLKKLSYEPGTYGHAVRNSRKSAGGKAERFRLSPLRR